MKSVSKYAVLVALLASAPVVANAQVNPSPAISSTFDAGVDGWRYGYYTGGGGDLPLTWDASSKLISSGSGFPSTGFIAPNAYLGNKTAYIGGTLSFDLATLSPVTDQRSLVVLTYGNGKHIFADWGPRPTADLQTFIVQLSASSFFDPSSGTPLDVTEAQFAEAMADLKQLFILGDWTGFIDTGRLDNVILAGPAASSVPEPGTWAMMIGGLGIVGASLRSRRRKLARI